MRRSFGNNRRMGGGGGMLRSTVRRVRAVGGGGGGVSGGDTVSRASSKSTSNILSLSTGSSSSSPSSVSACSTQRAPLPSWHSSCNNNSFYDSDIWDWETVEAGGYGDDGIYDRPVFGPVPSQDEVEDAVSSLQHVLASASYAQITGDKFSSGLDEDLGNKASSPPDSVHHVLSAESELDWIEPSLLGTMMYPGSERGRVYDAFHLLQTDPTVQRAVISLSTDRAVWDAVLNNDVVKELRDAYEAENKEQNPDEGPAAGKNVLKWILDSSKAKIMEFVDTITKLFAEVFPYSQMEKDTTEAKTTDVFQKRLKSSLMISIVVLLIVVMTRAHRV